jgi:HEAT repeat protein
MSRVTRWAAAATLFLLAGPVFAHGGQYRGPGGRSPNDPTAPGSAPVSTNDWGAWWSANAWRYLNLRERLRYRDRDPGVSASGGLGQAGTAEGTSTPVSDEAFDPREWHEKESLPAVTRALGDEDSEVRSAAAVALGKMAYARSLLDLRKALRDEVRDVRDGALLGLGMLGEPFAADDLRAVLLDPRADDRSRSFAAIALGFLRNPEAAETLVAFLDPGIDATRVGGIGRSNHTEASALTGLGLSGHLPAAGGIRKDYAGDKRYEPQVRAFAAVALARLGDREALPLILQGLEHAREPMRQSAALALGPLGRPGDAAVIQALARRVWEDKDLNTRQFALMSLARIGGEPAREAVRKVLAKGARIDLPWAALACAVGGDRESAPALRKLFLEEKIPSQKAAFALALGLLGDRELAPEFLRLGVNQGDSSGRIFALLALGLCGPPSAAREVRDLFLRENDPGVKTAAATCLGLLQDPEAIPLLERTVAEGENAYLRSSACRILGNIGSPSSSRVLAAVIADKKENSVVRMAATAALGNLADPRLIPLIAEVAIDGNYTAAVDPIIEISSIL